MKLIHIRPTSNICGVYSGISNIKYIFHDHLISYYIYIYIYIYMFKLYFFSPDFLLFFPVSVYQVLTAVMVIYMLDVYLKLCISC